MAGINLTAQILQRIQQPRVNLPAEPNSAPHISISFFLPFKVEFAFNGSFLSYLINTLKAGENLESPFFLKHPNTPQGKCFHVSLASLIHSDYLLFNLYLCWSILLHLTNSTAISIRVISFHFSSNCKTGRDISQFLSSSKNNHDHQRKRHSGLDNLAVTERINSVWSDNTGQSPWGMWRTGGRERERIKQ